MLSSEERERLQHSLQGHLSERRFKHSLNVSAAALELALIHAPELAREAEIAGMLHDNAKRMTVEDLMNAVREFDLQVSPEELAMPKLLHGKVGAALLPRRFGIDEAQITEACADHVTGRAGMGLLSRIVYVADQIAADRDFEGVEDLRITARRDLERALLLVAKNKVLHSLARHEMVEPQTLFFYNSMVRELGPGAATS